MSSGKALTLRIKSPGLATFECDVELSWRVSELKALLEAEHPAQTPAAQQKLVFSGGILKDEQVVRNGHCAGVVTHPSNARSIWDMSLRVSRQTLG